MTYEEAKFILEKNMSVFDARLNNAYDVAIEALDKQIPKPKHKYRGYRCVCGEEVAKHQDYCEYCGQKLLGWSDEG